jgi:hypothetical protein
MGFEYQHLDEADVRAAMVARWREEWPTLESLEGSERPFGKQLTPSGWERFAAAMPEALAEHDDEWLKDRMSDPSSWMEKYPRRKPKGGFSMVNYNKNDALERLCFGEFNIAYIRGLATALLDRGETNCVVYRADSAYMPRGECSGWEGQQFALQDVIDGHRARYWPPGQGNPSAFSVPSGPNCHHSINAVGA